jgi:hypothetical protein
MGTATVGHRKWHSADDGDWSKNACLSLGDALHINMLYEANIRICRESRASPSICAVALGAA